MKTLKFVHRVADDIREGLKTTTWRVNDEQDISLNDELELIDQVDRRDPATWRIIGTAKVGQVIEKRLGDIDENDLQGHQAFASREDMLQAYQHYAGPRVTLETPVKIVHFKMTTVNKDAETVAIDTSKITEIKLFADGGSRGNPGPSAGGFALMDMDGKVLQQKGIYLGITTNNQAEYQGLKAGLQEAQRLRISQVHVFMDSMLVINQMLGVFQVKNRELWPIHVEITELLSAFKRVSFTQVPRELNKIADRQVNIALDEAAKHQA